MIYKYDEKQAFEYENAFSLTSEIYRYGNMAAHWELYKKIINLPGDVIELGVFKGGSFVQWCSYRTLLENERSRKIVGFDVFGEFPRSHRLDSDKRFIEKWNCETGGDFLPVEELEKSLNYKNIGNYRLVKGDISETVQQYLQDNPHTRIALLHIDTDIYEPARVGLELLYERVVRGGVIVLDDYATIEGETIAVDEFFADKDIKIQKFPFSHAKPSFIIKD